MFLEYFVGSVATNILHFYNEFIICCSTVLWNCFVTSKTTVTILLVTFWKKLIICHDLWELHICIIIRIWISIRTEVLLISCTTYSSHIGRRENGLQLFDTSYIFLHLLIIFKEIDCSRVPPNGSVYFIRNSSILTSDVAMWSDLDLTIHPHSPHNSTLSSKS